MPQLDFHNPLTLSQVAWMFVIFALLYLLLAFWALPKVGIVVDSRAARIAGDLEAARDAKAKADAFAAELIRATRQAHDEAQARIADALHAVKTRAAEQARDMQAHFDQQLADAEKRIGQARQTALSGLHQVVVDTTQSVLTRLIHHTADPAAVDTAVGGIFAAHKIA